MCEEEGSMAIIQCDLFLLFVLLIGAGAQTSLEKFNSSEKHMLYMPDILK